MENGNGGNDNGSSNVKGAEKGCGNNNNNSEIKWELRPGGMLVQKRETGASVGEGVITVSVSTVSQWHDISIEATSTFGKPSYPRVCHQIINYIIPYQKLI